MTHTKPPFGIRIIAIVNGIAAILHLLFWGFAFIKLPSISSLTTTTEHANLATIYGFGTADMMWSVPLLIIGSFELLKSKTIGWLAAHMVNVLYWYSFTVILIRDVCSGNISPGTILFLPFAIFSFWTAYFLWKTRLSFLQ